MTRTATLFFIILMLVLALGVLSFFTRDVQPIATDTEPIAYTNDGYDYDTSIPWECNGDGKVCPDGTVVGRSGPRCEFTRCPGVIPASNAQITGTDRGVLAGSVMLSPTCPVEQMPPDPKCAPKPYETIVHVLKGERRVADVRTTAQGGFIVELAPGTYTVRAESAAVYPTCADTEVVVRKGERTAVTVDCDTGIR